MPTLIFCGTCERVLRLKAVLEEIIEPVVDSLGLLLYDLEFVKEGGSRILRLYIDKDGGVSLGECETVSRAGEARLDELDPIPSAYRLQVGSPGVERKLTKPWHYEKYLGHRVKVKLFTAYKFGESHSAKSFDGVLKLYRKDAVCFLDSQGEMLCLPHDMVSSCRLLVFDDAGSTGK